LDNNKNKGEIMRGLLVDGVLVLCEICDTNPMTHYIADGKFYTGICLSCGVNL
jgi:hypothetical protein